MTVVLWHKNIENGKYKTGGDYNVRCSDKIYCISNSFDASRVYSTGFWGALIAALVIAGLGYVVELIFGKRISPHGRGIVGFVVSAVVIYIAQFIAPTMHTNIWGALIAAFVIGIIDAFVPTELR